MSDAAASARRRRALGFAAAHLTVAAVAAGSTVHALYHHELLFPGVVLAAVQAPAVRDALEVASRPADEETARQRAIAAARRATGGDVCAYLYLQFGFLAFGTAPVGRAAPWVTALLALALVAAALRFTFTAWEFGAVPSAEADPANRPAATVRRVRRGTTIALVSCWSGFGVSALLVGWLPQVQPQWLVPGPTEWVALAGVLIALFAVAWAITKTLSAARAGTELRRALSHAVPTVPAALGALAALTTVGNAALIVEVTAVWACLALNVSTTQLWLARRFALQGPRSAVVRPSGRPRTS
ncbi:hypothetical protein SAMN05443637_11927 [Pseudonocardia thermophila]|uniref:Uncharacterized protein n=1 Tax=Pseudonocardia thermophila TaxID=1848 RepID=A0A1M6Y7N5_PSETH|nr:hypothetical protein [Pseudonocardia thermophila]SHL14142.1 hypothetical protein SAMN05443637_11927 [Pseudonocardia thermophila]